MTIGTRTTSTAGKSLVLRRTAAAAVLALGVSGLAACSEDSAGPEVGEVTLEDLQGIEEQVGALEERVGVLEEEGAGAGAGAGVGEEAEAEEGQEIFTDAESLIGQEGTVSGAVTEVITIASDVGSAFRIGGNTGEPVAVLSANPPAELEVDDVVRVSGTVVRVQRDTFEEDFGIAEDELFDDPDAFFEEEEGQAAVAADSIEVLQEQAEG